MTPTHVRPSRGALIPLLCTWLVLAAACLGACSADSQPGTADASPVLAAAAPDGAETTDAAPTAPDAQPADTASSAPAHVARFPAERPFDLQRTTPGGEGPDDAAIAAFTARMAAFYASTDFLRWTRRITHGVAADNPWGEPPYRFWWQDIEVVKAGELVTFVHTDGQDNMMSHHGRLFGPLVGAWLALPPGPQADLARELVLGFIRGVSATFTASIWADEDPKVPTIMARAIFHRNHTWTLDGGRRAAVDYEPERRAEIERRHDTVHNPHNPTWGDVWVRNKRSKDDLPWVFRMQVHLARLLAEAPDDELRAAALTLYDQLAAFAADVFDHGYIIRSKGPGGEVFIHYVSEGSTRVDDYASLVEFEQFVPNAECNAKLPIALLATGAPQGNDCGDGRSTTYEEVGLNRFYGHTWMQWNFHVSAIATSFLYGAHDAAQSLLTGLGLRFDALHTRDDAIANDPRYRADLAHTFLLGATYGLPLTAQEAHIIIEEFTTSADHHAAWPLWDLWSPTVPDGSHPYLPGASHEDPTRDHIHIEDMPLFFEYCASPLRAHDGAQFFDCAAFLAADTWP